MNKKLAAVMVTFRADTGVVARIENLCRIFDETIVVDNGSSSEFFEALSRLAGPLAIIANGENKGIAAALNAGIVAAKTKNADWIACFDQDSILFNTYRGAVEAAIDVVPESAGILACNYYLENKNDPRHSMGDASIGSVQKVSEAITSGSVYKSSIFSKLGYFKENYFIDAVDKEYCWRAARHNIDIFFILEPQMRHSIGTPISRYFLGKKITSQNHPPMRKYYIARNNLFLIREYWRFRPRDCLMQLVYIARIALLIFLIDENKSDKIKSFSLGIFHGFIKRF
ncbi:glycosyltransferase [Rhizobium sp. BK376]|uniref:glycosyltransferase n=1 Tax=Rhizobium sp. BK376 TaxID=2512149 RepID=UPI0010492A76|nr:glycosyltransferase [Rhizobium sp. BK376]TCR71856.1 rhamnosyltransferase [Rhizobium sp. BK376]